MMGDSAKQQSWNLNPDLYDRDPHSFSFTLAVCPLSRVFSTIACIKDVKLVETQVSVLFPVLAAVTE